MELIFYFEKEYYKGSSYYGGIDDGFNKNPVIHIDNNYHRNN